MLAQTRPFNPRGVYPEVKDVPLPGNQGSQTVQVATLKGFEAVFFNLVAVALGLAGIVLFIMLVMGGFTLLTAGGEQPKIEQAKKTITYALGGFILLVLASLILRLIADFTGVQVFNFQITQ